ncbi:hypothetical protein D3C71_1415050 [compost metagenome]
MLLQRGGQLRAFGFLDRDEVLDRHGVQHLAAEPLGRHAGADALARRIDRRRRAGRTAADHQHVERGLGGELGRIARGRPGIELGHDLLQGHAALVEQLAIEVDRGHRHDLARLDLGREQPAVDRHVLDARVEHRRQVERLDHVRAVLAGQREIGFELQLALQALHLLDQLGGGLGRVPAHLQQRQHQRGELVAHRQPGEGQVDVLARGGQGEGGGALGAVPAHVQADLRRQRHQRVEQLQHFLRLGAVIRVRRDLDRTGDTFQVGLQLGLEVGIQHRKTP